MADAIERAQMEAGVRKHRDALAHALRVGTMEQLASGVAHELNQPLAAILNYASASEHRVAAGNTDIESMRDAARRIAEQAVRTAVGFVEPDLIAPGIEIVQEHETDLPNVQVDPDRVEFLFGEFYTIKEHGLGLGLSISRSIVDSYGVALWLESTSPSGTTFCFSLPAAPQ